MDAIPGVERVGRKRRDDRSRPVDRCRDQLENHRWLWTLVARAVGEENLSYQLRAGLVETRDPLSRC